MDIDLIDIENSPDYDPGFIDKCKSKINDLLHIPEHLLDNKCDKNFLFKDYPNLATCSLWEYFRDRMNDNKLYIFHSRIEEIIDNRLYLVGYIGKLSKDDKEELDENLIDVASRNDDKYIFRFGDKISTKIIYNDI